MSEHDDHQMTAPAQPAPWRAYHLQQLQRHMSYRLALTSHKARSKELPNATPAGFK